MEDGILDDSSTGRPVRPRRSSNGSDMTCATDKRSVEGGCFVSTT